MNELEKFDSLALSNREMKATDGGIIPLVAAVAVGALGGGAITAGILGLAGSSKPSLSDEAHNLTRHSAIG